MLKAWIEIHRTPRAKHACSSVILPLPSKVILNLSENNIAPIVSLALAVCPSAIFADWSNVDRFVNFTLFRTFVAFLEQIRNAGGSLLSRFPTLRVVPSGRYSTSSQS
ncbi:putative polyamine oxidase (ISS) protein [Corchorus olitorius]|uniref:Polyamine oxidase (ISS) protein n=1 Tax=Corchorus olitorius TaxID=93759 RepID=A0A1R3GMU2_9ROSI|nr:putative polyamine oxidase (ISS) protein [Corchorus olitorius]